MGEMCVWGDKARLKNTTMGVNGGCRGEAMTKGDWDRGGQ